MFIVISIRYIIVSYKIVRSLFVINLFILFQREVQIWIFFKFLELKKILVRIDVANYKLRSRYTFPCWDF